MAKKGHLSVKQRREEMRRQQQAQQNRLIAIIGGVLAVAVVAYIVWQVVSSGQANNSPTEGVIEGERPLAALDPAERNTYYGEYPATIIDTNKEYEALIQTAKGDMRIRLLADQAPMTVNNFVFLATQGFYDNTTFHRVLPNFMAQGGDPTGTGLGGPGYQFEDETDNGLVFDRRGLLAMANAGPNTNGSQFFITFAPAEHLNGAHTIFGELIEGDNVLGNLTLRNPDQAPTTPGDTIERIDIIEK
jgi:peptidylprolyl isomerase